MMETAVFLDRDGTINANKKGYVRSWREFEFIPGALAAIAALSKTRHRIFVVTNQAGVGRGKMTAKAVEEIHERMLSAVEAAGGRIDGVLVCMHAPDDGCGCRKPKTGLIDLAKEAYDLDLGGSWFIGDNTKDVLAGNTAGCKTILVKTGWAGEDGLYDAKADYEAKDLKSAVELID